MATPINSGSSGNLAVALRLAANGLLAVAERHALDEALAAAGVAAQSADRAAAQDIAYNACRRLNLLDALAGSLLKKPNPAIDPLAKAALSELIDHPQRAHMIVDEAVKAIAPVRAGAYKGTLNAVLRRFQRERETLLAAAADSEAVRLGYPAWWIARIRAAWPAQWSEVLRQGNARAPMTLRVNLRRASVDAYLQMLGDAGIEATRAGGAALHLARPRPTRLLPGFAAGLVSVQDLGAQLAAHLLDAQTGMRVLDACAAPGGKLAHLLEQTDCGLLAIDRDTERLKAVQLNLERLGLKAQVRAGDAADARTWRDGGPFDRILLDAPCSASGVIRRHPDGKWLKRESDLAAHVREQSRLLDALWQGLRPGGKLLYATCSVFPDENQRQAARFLSSHPDAVPLPIAPQLAAYNLASELHSDGQLLPAEFHDGFYYALLGKRPD